MDKHSLNNSFISVTLSEFHLDILGKEDNEEQFSNIFLIFIILIVFHLEISDRKDYDEQNANIEFILDVLPVSHLDISGIDIKLEQP